MNKFGEIYEQAQACFTDGKHEEAETLYRKLLDLKIRRVCQIFITRSVLSDIRLEILSSQFPILKRH